MLDYIYLQSIFRLVCSYPIAFANGGIKAYLIYIDAIGAATPVEIFLVTSSIRPDPSGFYFYLRGGGLYF